MAHELSIRENGFVEMAYAGEKPWHGLGQELREDASLEEWTIAAGMDWRVKRSFVRYSTSMQDTPETLMVDKENVVLFRGDTKVPLGLVSKDFKIVQPRDIIEFFRDLADAGGYKLCTAGVLQGGRKFWAQAETGMEDAVVGDDVVKARLLIATACDGSMRTKVKKVAERVVCANTLAIATRESGQEVNVSHKSKFNADSVKAQMGLALFDFAQFMTKAKDLARQQVTEMDADKFLLPIIADIMKRPIDQAAGMLAVAEQLKDVRGNVGYRKIMELFQGKAMGATLAGSKGTAWGLVNAVTEYVDHHRGNVATTRDNRLDYAWFGEGEKLKSKVFEQAVQAFA